MLPYRSLEEQAGQANQTNGVGSRQQAMFHRKCSDYLVRQSRQHWFFGHFSLLFPNQSMLDPASVNQSVRRQLRFGQSHFVLLLPLSGNSESLSRFPAVRREQTGVE